MKKNYIKDFQFGDKLVDCVLAVKECKQLKTLSGKSYIDLLLSDKTGDIDAKIWETNIDACAEVKAGDVVQLNCSVEEFRDKQQLKVTFLQKLVQFDPSDFVPASTKDQAELWQKIKGKIAEISSREIKELLNYFFTDKAFVAAFKLSTAAEKIHHACIGGLMEHVGEMLDIADGVVKNYPELNKDYLFAGILLHDIGKMKELSVTHIISRTTAGYLIGHLSLGAMMVNEAMNEIKNFPDATRNVILHLIYSHHGELEFGSPIKPMTREAFALYYIDNLSAKVNTADKTIREADGAASGFTPFNFFLDTKLYIN